MRPAPPWRGRFGARLMSICGFEATQNRNAGERGFASAPERPTSSRILKGNLQVRTDWVCCEEMARVPIQFTIERAWREVAAIEEAFERGEIDEARWHERMASLVVPAYLAGDNPRAQSGYSGTEADWEQ